MPNSTAPTLFGKDGISAAGLKLLACVFMFIDHTGLLLFPNALFLRIIGRLAFPIFAFFIAEGCRYSRHELRRFLTIFLLGVVYETVYVLFSGGWYGNILLTFSCSILLITLLQRWKRSMCGDDRKRQFLYFLAFFASVALIGLVICRIGIDYGFPGIMLPVLISLFDYREGETPETRKKLHRSGIKLLVTAAGLILVAAQPNLHNLQYFSLFALPLLALYNGKPGPRGFKYGFYVFYPAHLLLLQAAALLI